VSTSLAVQGETVTGRDLTALVEKVESQYASDTRELLHTVPVGYRVDARETVEDPRGFRGRVLTGEFFLIDADKFYLRDVVDVCNECGLQVVRLYSEPFASASVTVPDTHKQLGVALADIGGGTTDGIVFKSGRPVSVFTVNVAGKLMTNDLAIGLSTTPDEAEKVKIRFGVKPRAGDSCDLRDLRGATRVITAKDVNPILLPRIHELGGLIAQALMPFRGTLGGGLLLTGGGADVKGIAEYFHLKMGVPVLRARPVLADAGTGISAEATLTRSTHPTKHATVIGLLNLELGRLSEAQKSKKTTWTTRYLGQFVNWIKELS
jgi:cell division protein FtsA